MQLSVDNLTYKHKNNLNFALGPINISATNCLRVLGGNGQGKTTFLRCVAGIFKPNSGNVFVNNASFSVVWVGCEAPIYWDTLSGLEFLRLQAYLYGASKSEVKESLRQLKNIKLNLKFLNQNVFSMSTGQKKILSISAALFCPAKMVVLDEPDSNLDDENKKIIFDIIFNPYFVKEKFILFSSHDDSSLNQQCQSLILKRGATG